MRLHPGLLSVALLASTLFPSALGGASGGKRLDDGLLDPSWFGPEVSFRKTPEIDYIWVKAGFSIKGRTIHVDRWSDPELFDDQRDAKDSAKAAELTEVMPSRLRGALAATLASVAKVSREDGNLLVTGRIVDCDAGSKAAKFWVGFGAGASSATFDLKITDKLSGELLAAIHHRVVSGSSASDVDDKIAKWLEKFGEALPNDLVVAASGPLARK